MHLKKSYMKLGIVAFVFIFLSLLVWLSFGSCQSTRFHYIVQIYILRDIEDVYPPSKYTGVWRTWHKNGELESEFSYRNGKLHGECFCWSNLGVLRVYAKYRDGSLVEPPKIYSKDGTILNAEVNELDKPMSPTFYLGKKM